MRLRRILTDTGVRSPASWEVRHRYAGWGPGAGRLGDTAGAERGAATAAYGRPFCQTLRPTRTTTSPTRRPCPFSERASPEGVDHGVAEVEALDAEPRDGFVRGVRPVGARRSGAH